MGSAYFLREGIGQHSRNVSYPCWHGGLRKASDSDMESLKDTPRISRDHASTAVELIKEISTLENEIVHLEQYLLSLYRAVFSPCLTDSPAIAQQMKPSLDSSRKFQIENDRRVVEYSTMLENPLSSIDYKIDDRKMHLCHWRGYSMEVADDESKLKKDYLSVRTISDVSSLSEVVTSKKEDQVTPCSRTLGDLLCSSQRENVLDTPTKLSEDIIRCISAVYCKLNNAKDSRAVLSSPFSSLSSSSTLSMQDRSDKWSPQCDSEISQSPVKEKYYSCPAMIEVSRISIDKDRFKYAAVLLERHRNLIKRLETVDPNKMVDEEKLAFWINIHNAMVMHAFIAYGLENNHIKSTPLLLKKSYNVGGRNFNAQEIQSSILGCRPHHKNPRTIFTTSGKSRTINTKHPFALRHPDPLVHFALSMGAYSDPPVRVYTAMNVTKQLEAAKEDFIQANVFIHHGNKIMLPKILEFYAKDASLDLPSLLEVVHNCLPKDQKHALRECLKGKLDRRVQWSPYRTTFRYILHRDLDMNK